MEKKFRKATYVRYIGELPEVDLREDGLPADVRSDIRFTFENTNPFTVQYVTIGMSLFGIYTIDAN
jgi:hypothetical protein